MAAERELRESEEKFRHLFEHSAVGMSLTRPGGELHVNQAFCDMLGYTIDELDSHAWQDVSHPDDVARTQEHVARLLAGHESSARFLKRYVSKDGEIVWADVSTALRRDERGEPLYFITAAIDISDRVRADEEIRRLNDELEQRVLDRTAQLDTANRELEAFAYSVSHDLRAPLRHLSGFSELLADRAGDALDEKSRHYLDTILRSAREMGVLIDDLLQFSRTGRVEVRLEDVDMEEALGLALETLRHETDARAIEWRIAPLPHVTGDRALLRQVWANLLGNAVKYTRTREPAVIEVGVLDGAAAERPGDVFFVRDNGVGFDMQYAHKLFGVFQRLHSSGEFEGTGIGLANVQRIVTRLGGRVWAEGATGEGATFFFSLPHRKGMQT